MLSTHDCAGDQTGDFHHFVDGCDAGLVGQISTPKLFWAQRSPFNGLAMREVWDSGDLVVNLRASTGSIKVRCRIPLLGIEAPEWKGCACCEVVCSHQEAWVVTQANFDMRMQVWLPCVRAVFGELQYELVLAALWENAAEPPTFAPRPPPYSPIGQPLPPTPPEPVLLGVDKTQSPLWQCEVCVHKFVSDVEALLRDSTPSGSGASLGLVRTVYQSRQL